ncbi:hypothetical protein PMAYCL1PPCAC_11117, partial [Pristionchus mayeri]
AEIVTCAKEAKEIVNALKALDAKAQAGIKQYFKQRSAEDVAVLATMLERCSASSNANLHADFAKHRIPERIKKIYGIATSSWHYHDWCNGSDNVRTFLDCVGR